MPGRQRQITTVVEPIANGGRKLVSAAEAARVMGGFSLPRAHSYEKQCAVSVEAVLEEHRFDVVKMHRLQAEKIHDSARMHVQRVNYARSRGLWWTHTDSFGGRHIVVDQGARPHTVNDEGFGQWEGFQPSHVKEAEYTSASSGSTLRYVRKGGRGGREWGELVFVPSEKDPGYRGQYYNAWKEAEEYDFRG